MSLYYGDRPEPRTLREELEAIHREIAWMRRAVFVGVGIMAGNAGLHIIAPLLPG